jgi:hypothetical protein
MHPRSVSMKTNGRSSLGGINRPPTSTKDAQQGLTTLARESPMSSCLIARHPHSISIARNHDKKES